MRNLPLTLEDIAESDVKAIAAQQKSLDSLTKVVLVNRIDLDYHLAEQGRDYHLAEQGCVCAVANTTCNTCVNTSGGVGIQLHKIMEQSIWLKKVTP